MQHIDQLTVNTIRMLSAEAVQKANSGHPGLPMGAAPTAYALYDRTLRFNPKNPSWANRDRFILSAGHGSMLLYSLLHLYNYGLTIEDIKNFRQWDSLTPGHPEYKHTAGVEMTTGPLGQGISTAVGFAAAEAHLAATYNREGFPVFDHYTYVLVGDGCLQEGVSSEACSLAGTWKLGKLIVLYDDNRITIEGDTAISFTEDATMRYAAYGWHVQEVLDGNDVDAIHQAIENAKQVGDKPSLIRVKTEIGFGSPKQGKASAHGEPLGEENLKLTREVLGWNYAPFTVPEEVAAHTARKIAEGAELEKAWDEMLAGYQQAHPELYKQLVQDMEGTLPEDLFNEEFYTFPDKPDATRNVSGALLNRLAPKVPALFGGSADLAPSTKTLMNGRGDFSCEDYAGANLRFGVREFAMAAIGNGFALHGGLRPYVATFFVFSDYMKPAMRLSALMGLNLIYVLTHDSIGVGEDGPTHQPIEQEAMLRSIPGMTVYRPADARETAAAYEHALKSDGPTSLLLTRQNLPQLEGSGKDALRGGYILKDSKKALPDIILMATGSEVSLVVEASEQLAGEGIDARVVSMPSLEVFNRQDAEYREQVLPAAVRARLAVEAASTFGWHRYVGLDGDVIGLDHFGASAPASILFEKFGFTVDEVVRRARAVINKLDA